MAQAPLLQLSDIALTFGGNPLFEGVSLVVHPGDRIALVGRNGSGKSTLLRVMAGVVEADAGARVLPPGVTAGYMEQDPDMSGFATLGDFAAAGLAAGRGVSRGAAWPKGCGSTRPRRWRRRRAGSGGGRRSRGCMAAEPELMLLDEPTNHLDITAIGWLEAELQATKAAVVLISHDRAFLRALTRTTLWLDRGELRRNDRGFSDFEAWRDRIWAEEDDQRHKLERKIKAEGQVGGRRHQRAAQAQPGPRARAAGAARGARGDDPPAGRRRDGVRRERQDREEGHRGARDIKGLRREADPVRASPSAWRGATGWPSSGPNGVGKTTLLKMLTGRDRARCRDRGAGNGDRDGGLRPDPRGARSGDEPLGEPHG